MKIMMQLAIIFAICLVGELIAALLPIPVPASVISMVLVFCLLLWGPLKVYHIRKQTDFLLDNMAFFFIPPAVSIVENLQYMEGKLAILIFICFISIFTTFAVTAWTVMAMIKWDENRKERKRRARLAAKSQ